MNAYHDASAWTPKNGKASHAPWRIPSVSPTPKGEGAGEAFLLCGKGLIMPHQDKNKPLHERVLDKCQSDPSGCILWTGYTLDGYGKIRWHGKRLYVHRVMYEYWHGPIPIGLLVCHKCDIRNCIEATHLFTGTIADNIADKVGKGRQAHGPLHGLRGEAHPLTKINNHAVLSIRSAYAAKAFNQYELAQLYGLSQSYVSQIINHKNRKDIICLV